MTDMFAKIDELDFYTNTELLKDLDQNQELTIYKQGKWFDLCKGPHSPSTGFVGNSFKLLKLEYFSKHLTTEL